MSTAPLRLHGGVPPNGVEPTTAASWPIVALLAGYPLWWLLGLGVIIFPLLAVPMAYGLWQRRSRLKTPPGFAWWLLFLAAVVISMAALGVDPDGTVPGSAIGRLPAVAFRLVEYGSLTVMLLWVGNLTPTELPQKTLVGLLAGLLVVTVAGGLLGTFAPAFELTSPVEALLPQRLRRMGFVRSLVHPASAQLMDVFGTGKLSARPAAPWGYTNTWGNNFQILAVWFVVFAFAAARRRGLRLAAIAVLAVSIIPVVHSLNRGLWIGLAITAGWVALRLAWRGRFAALTGLAMAGAAVAVLVVATPLGALAGDRVENGRSTAVRAFVTERAVQGLLDSPVIGYGSTRNTLGGRTSIAVGQSADCERCGNFTLGGNGQLWQLGYAHGLLGTVSYLAFLAYPLWRFRHDHTAVGIGASAVLVASFAAMLWYNALVTPLAFLFLSLALLWRSHESGSYRAGHLDRG